MKYISDTRPSKIEYSQAHNEWWVESLVDVELPPCTITFFNEGKEYLALNTQKIHLNQVSHPDLTSSMVLTLSDAILADLSKLNSFHNEILGSKPGEILRIELLMRTLNRFESDKHKFEYYMGIKITGAKILYLKRAIQEMTEYFRFRVQNCFADEDPVIVQQRRECQSSPSPKSILTNKSKSASKDFSSDEPIIIDLSEIKPDTSLNKDKDSNSKSRK